MVIITNITWHSKQSKKKANGILEARDHLVEVLVDLGERGGLCLGLGGLDQAWALVLGYCLGSDSAGWIRFSVLSPSSFSWPVAALECDSAFTSEGVSKMD